MLYLWYNIDVEQALQQGMVHVLDPRYPQAPDDGEDEDVNLDGWDYATNVLIQARDDKTRGHNGLVQVMQSILS